MRQLRVTYRKQARSDLEEIYNSVLQVSQNKATAYNFYKRIVSRCNRIGLVPFGGRSRDDLEPGLRTVPFEHSAVIAYKVEHDCVRIVNVFHGRRDYEGFIIIPARPIVSRPTKKTKINRPGRTSFSNEAPTPARRYQ